MFHIYLQSSLPKRACDWNYATPDRQFRRHGSQHTFLERDFLNLSESLDAYYYHYWQQLEIDTQLGLMLEVLQKRQPRKTIIVPTISPIFDYPSVTEIDVSLANQGNRIKIKFEEL